MGFPILNEKEILSETAERREEMRRILQDILDFLPESPQAVRTLRNGKTQELLFSIMMNGARYTLLRTYTESKVIPSDFQLSPREQEIARLVAKGFPNKAIGTLLEISPWTVATHLRRIFAKIGVGSRTEMVAKVMKEGLLDRGSDGAGKDK